MLIGYNNTLSHILSIYIYMYIYSHTRLTHIHQTYDQPTTNPDDIDGHSSGSSTSIQGKSYVYIRLNIHFILVLPHFPRFIFCISCHFNLKPHIVTFSSVFLFTFRYIHKDFEFHPPFSPPLRALHFRKHIHAYYIYLFPFHNVFFLFSRS